MIRKVAGLIHSPFLDRLSLMSSPQSLRKLMQLWIVHCTGRGKPVGFEVGFPRGMGTGSNVATHG
jgi:hypothetical protein